MTLAWLLSASMFAGSAIAGETLWLVPDTRPAALALLVANGGTVSRVEGPAAFVYCHGIDCERTAAGFEGSVRLDAGSEAAEYFLLFDADAAHLQAIRPPMRLLSHRDAVAVVAVPEDHAEWVSALGLDTAKLFRSPMRIAPWDEARHLVAQLITSAQIESLVAEVSVESLDATVAHLQGFGTRRATKAGGREAAQWIASRLRAYGIDDVRIEAWDPSLAGNVVATLRGRTDPQDVYIIGGHYDSIVPDSDFEPGADDNASGTAAVLECARVFARFPMASTVRFIAFGGEELGLLGSEAYASQASARHEWITGMFNLDMIG